jgi:putative transposase
MAGDWKLFLGTATEEEMEKIRRHERSGRPLGSERFVERLESTLERLLTPGKPGPKGKGN